MSDESLPTGFAQAYAKLRQGWVDDDSQPFVLKAPKPSRPIRIMVCVALVSASWLMGITGAWLLLGLLRTAGLGF